MSNTEKEAHQLPQNETSLEEAAFEALRNSGDMIERRRVAMKYAPTLKKYGLCFQASSGGNGNMVYQLQLGHDQTRVFIGQSTSWETSLKRAIDKAVSELTPAEIEKGKSEIAEKDRKSKEFEEASPFREDIKRLINRLSSGQSEEKDVSSEQAALRYLSENYNEVIMTQLLMQFQPAMAKYGLTLGSVGTDHEGDIEVNLRPGYNDAKTFKGEDRDPETAFRKAFEKAVSTLTPAEIEKAIREREVEDPKWQKLEERMRAPFRKQIENIIKHLRK